jgi:DNA-binding NtrC family response regulator
MNFANPILICDENEEFRILVRDMLTKNGFFHVLEAVNAQDAIDILREKKGYFILIESKALTNEMSETIQRQKNFIIFAENNDSKTMILSARLGVDHIMSYPFHSKKLIDKINSLI